MNSLWEHYSRLIVKDNAKVKEKHILLATRNKGKIVELSEMLKDFRLLVLGLHDFPALEEVEETGSTFAENALLKASYASKSTGLVAVADDSGLVVEALNGAPGVYSARFSAEPDNPATDERNNLKLLKLLKDMPPAQRGACFVSVIAATAPDGTYIMSEGRWDGQIAFAQAGTNGFGYDSVFVVPEMGLTAAQLSPEEKNQRSHRGRALRSLKVLWPDFWNNFSGVAFKSSPREFDAGGKALR